MTPGGGAALGLGARAACLGGRLAVALLGGLLLGPRRRGVQRRQDRQSPAALARRQLHVHRQHHPLVPPFKDGVAPGRADRVAVASPGPDLLARVAGHGVVAVQHHRLLGGDQFQHRRRQHSGQRPHRPAGGAEEAVIAAGVPVGQVPHCPKNPADRPPAHCYNGPDAKHQEPIKAGRGKGTGKPPQQLRLLRQREHTPDSFPVGSSTPPTCKGSGRAPALNQLPQRTVRNVQKSREQNGTLLRVSHVPFYKILLNFTKLDLRQCAPPGRITSCDNSCQTGLAHFSRQIWRYADSSRALRCGCRGKGSPRFALNLRR